MRKISYNGKKNPQYNRAYQSLHYKLIKKPAKDALNALKVKKVITDTATIVSQDFSIVSHTDDYKVAREGRTQEMKAKKLVINLSSSMTCTIEDNGLITVNFK